MLHKWEMAKKPDQLSPLARHWALQELLGRLDAAKLELVDEGKTWDQLAEGVLDSPAARVYDLAGITIMIEADAAYKAASFSLANWEDLHVANPVSWGRERGGILKRFLRGETLTEYVRDASLAEQQRLFRFLTQVSVVGSEQRSTTQERDLVLAIWPDCPRYEIPGGYKDMSLPNLLGDAVLQLEHKWKVSFVTWKPSGLFTTAHDTRDALLWRPTSIVKSGRTTKCIEVSVPGSTSTAFLTITCGVCRQLRFHHLVVSRTSSRGRNYPVARYYPLGTRSTRR